MNESRERGTNNELYFVIHSGYGKTHKDAASVRTTHSIPAACGLYYFEVKIVSKGRDGYMGIGLSAHGVNVNRLPGWDKHSYGYHGDDGNSFCSSGTGQPYGPTFTTGDVIGCGINLVDNTAFYTKNGHHLGIAFTDLPVRHFNFENFFIFHFECFQEIGLIMRVAASQGKVSNFERKNMQKSGNFYQVITVGFDGTQPRRSCNAWFRKIAGVIFEKNSRIYRNQIL